MSRGVARTCLALLVLLALGLRAPGIGYLLPEVMNRDGLVVIQQAEFFRTGVPPAGDPAWWYSSYPHLMARIAAVLPAEEAGAGPRSLEEHLAVARAPWIALRWISIAFALLAVPGTYLLARRFLGRAGSLVAAALVATSLHHVVLSIQEKPHAAGASLVLVALLAALRLRRRPDLLAYLACGGAAALAVGMLHSGLAALLPIGAAFLLRDRSTRRAASPAWILATLAIAAVAFRLLYSFFFEDLADPIPGTMPAAGPDAAGFAGRLAANARGAPVGKLAGAIAGLDPVLVALGLAGIVAWAFRRRGSRDLLVVLALALPTLAVLLAFRGTLVRFFVPLYPLLACAAGYAFERARERSGSPRAAAAAAVLLLAVALVPVAHFARIRTAPGPLREAARWVVERVDPRDVVLVVPNVDLGLFTTSDATSQNATQAWRTIWTEHLARVLADDVAGERRPILIEPGRRPQSRADMAADPLGWARRYRARWVVFDLSGGGGHLYGDVARRAARFSPAREDRPDERGLVLFGTGYDPLAPSALRVLAMRSLGTAVEVFEIP